MLYLLIGAGLLTGAVSVYYVDAPKKRINFRFFVPLIATMTILSAVMNFAYAAEIATGTILLYLIVSSLVGAVLYYVGVFLLWLFLFWYFRG